MNFLTIIFMSSFLTSTSLIFIDQTIYNGVSIKAYNNDKKIKHPYLTVTKDVLLALIPGVNYVLFLRKALSTHDKNVNKKYDKLQRRNALISIEDDLQIEIIEPEVASDFKGYQSPTGPIIDVYEYTFEPNQYYGQLEEEKKDRVL